VRQTDEISRELERYIRTVPDFPKPGISFKDITPLIENGEALHAATDALHAATDHLAYDRILSAEARGFVFGTALAYRAHAISPGTRVLVADDLLATGGTARAMCELVESGGGTVAGVAFLIELSYLNGRDRLAAYEVISLITYDDPAQ